MPLNKDNKHREDTALRTRQKKIGVQLKQLYDEIVSEDVPDDFMKLLEEADKKSSSGGNSDNSASQV